MLNHFLGEGRKQRKQTGKQRKNKGEKCMERKRTEPFLTVRSCEKGCRGSQCTKATLSSQLNICGHESKVPAELFIKHNTPESTSEMFFSLLHR